MKSPIKLVLIMLAIGIPEVLACYWFSTNIWLFSAALLTLSISMGWIIGRYIYSVYKNSLFAKSVGGLIYSLVYPLFCYDISLYKNFGLAELQIPIYSFTIVLLGWVLYLCRGKK